MFACRAADTVPAAHLAAHYPRIIDSHDSVNRIGGTPLYLDVTLNGATRGLAHFVNLNDELWASAATLRDIGFELPASTPDPVRLSRLDGTQIDYDVNGQAVTIHAPLSLLKLTATVLNTPDNRRPRANASSGVLLNYNFYGTEGRQGSSFSAFNELRGFNRGGVFSSTVLSQWIRDKGEAWRDRSVRLDTRWSTSFPDSLLTLRIGDTLTNALSWSRPTRIAGIQLGTNFTLQPYLVTTPLPAFLGAATLPSNVQLYVDGVQRYSGSVPAGPFQLNTMPNISGAGNAQVVLTDALGRATTLNFSLYGEPQLLRQGLSDGSVELGVVRKNYGLTSFDYGHQPALSGTWRYGVSDRLTVEAHGEATNSLMNIGGGGALLLGNAGGIVVASLAQSRNSGRGGSLYALGYRWHNSRFNFSVNSIQTRGDYSDVATRYGPPPPRVSAQAIAGYSTDYWGNFGVSYVQLRYPQQSATRYAGAYWSKSIGRSLSLNLSFNQDLDNAASRSLFLGVTIALDHNVTASGGVQRDGDRTALVFDASQSPPGDGGMGWRAALRQGNDQRGGLGELSYLGRYGQVSAGASAIGQTRFGYASASGALVLMDGNVLAARSIDTGFAVVSTDGIGQVPVKLENNLVGTTDGRGMLLVSPLNPYQYNRLSIDPMDLPADVRIDRVTAFATPTDRAGTLVRFGITPIRAASVILHDAHDQPLPIGSCVTLTDQAGHGTMVGFDGMAYLDRLKDHNTLIVHTPSGVCQTRFEHPDERERIPVIGPLICLAMRHCAQRRLALTSIWLWGSIGWVQLAQAQSASCANPTISNVQFGSVNLSTGTVNISGSISWSCTSTGILGILLSPQANILMCLNLNAGTGGAQANPRLLSNGANTLQYQLYTNAVGGQIWGSTAIPATPTPLSISVAIPAGVLFSTTVSGQTPFYAQLPSGQTSAPAGTYNSTLSVTVNGAYTLNTSAVPSSCTSGPNTLNTGSATFVASATVQKACLVTANPVNFGTVSANTANATANNTLGVTCTNGTPYYVGLAPSNGNTGGAGVMAGTLSGNTDKVPYQLRSTSGLAGTPWGNTATSTAVGNGVAGIGNGLAQSLMVYATVSSANYTPDNYTDTVTVNVNY